MTVLEIVTAARAVGVRLRRVRVGDVEIEIDRYQDDADMADAPAVDVATNELIPAPLRDALQSHMARQVSFTEE